MKRDFAIVVVTLVVGLLLYRSYTLHQTAKIEAAYQPGDSSSSSFSDTVEMVDKLNAGLSHADAERFVNEATKNGTLDVDKLGELLKPAAIRAGKLVQLQRELSQLASGNGLASAGRGAVARAPSPAADPVSNAPSTVSTPDKPTKTPTIEPTQTGWKTLHDKAYYDELLLVARGTITGPAIDAHDLVAPGLPAYAPLVRLCRKDDCYDTYALVPDGGVEFRAQFCPRETPPYDRIEYWFNGRSDGANSAHGAYAFGIERDSLVTMRYSCVALNMRLPGLKQPGADQ